MQNERVGNKIHHEGFNTDKGTDNNEFHEVLVVRPLLCVAFLVVENREGVHFRNLQLVEPR